MMLIESRILLTSHVSCNLCKNITPQFHSDNLRKLYKSVFFYLSSANKNLETCTQV